jgi:hypothetical protein
MIFSNKFWKEQILLLSLRYHIMYQSLYHIIYHISRYHIIKCYQFHLIHSFMSEVKCYELLRCLKAPLFLGTSQLTSSTCRPCTLLLCKLMLLFKYERIGLQYLLISQRESKAATLCGMEALLGRADRAPTCS